MKNYPGIDAVTHDPADPNPWYALGTETMTPLRPQTKESWLKDSGSASRQYFLPFVRPFARFMIMLIQVIKIIIPIQWRASKTLHWLIVWGLKHFVRPDANWNSPKNRYTFLSALVSASIHLWTQIAKGRMFSSFVVPSFNIFKY